MDKNEKKERNEDAWFFCKFCRQSDDKIFDIILDKERWNELPLSHKCGWARICQVAYKENLKSEDIWRSLCRERGQQNSRQLDGLSSYWLEGYCETYKKVNDDMDD